MVSGSDELACRLLGAMQRNVCPCLCCYADESTLMELGDVTPVGLAWRANTPEDFGGTRQRCEIPVRITALNQRSCLPYLRTTNRSMSIEGSVCPATSVPYDWTEETESIRAATFRTWVCLAS